MKQYIVIFLLFVASQTFGQTEVEKILGDWKFEKVSSDNQFLTEQLVLEVFNLNIKEDGTFDAEIEKSKISGNWKIEENILFLTAKEKGNGPLTTEKMFIKSSTDTTVAFEMNHQSPEESYVFHFVRKE